MRIDPAPIHAIFAARGDLAAEALVCRSLEDIAVKLDILQAALQSHEFAQVKTPARRIVLVGAQIGLVDVSLSAEHVVIAAQQEDGVALGATLGRLERAFDVAVTQVWHYGGYY